MGMNDFLSNLLTNLLSECIGITITVFLVDRLLKRRDQRKEERVWLPLKHLVFRNLFEIFDLFLLREFGITPAGNPRWFYFGSVKILGSGKFSNYEKSRVESGIRTSQLQDKEGRGYGSIARYLEVKEEVERVLNTSARVLGPELTTLLVSFNNAVSIFTQSSLGDHDYEALRQNWFHIGIDAFKVRLYLQEAADKCLTPQEDAASILKPGPNKRI
jgi:hypothetical protein